MAAKKKPAPKKPVKKKSPARAKDEKKLSDNKAHLRKKMKLEMLRYCIVWGYGERQTIEYFKARGEELSHTHYYELKAEFESDESTKNWYTEQAISAMESTHKQSVEQLDELIKTTMAEIQQLQATPVYITQTKRGSKEPVVKFNPNHNPIALAKMMETLSNLMKTRDDMLAATPVVQAIISKNARDRAKNEAGGLAGHA